MGEPPRVHEKAKLKVVLWDLRAPGDLFCLSDSRLIAMATNLDESRKWRRDDEWTKEIAQRVRYGIGRLNEDEVLLLSFVNLAVVNPSDLVRGLRSGIRLGRRDVAPRPGLVGISWAAASGESQVLRHAVWAHWELLDRRNPKARLPVPLSTESGDAILGHLPASLYSHFGGLTERLVTYHNLRGLTREEKTPKQLGRLLARYRKLGLVVPRGYATVDDLADIGLDADDLKPTARPQVWESVLPAIAEEEWRTLKVS